MPKLSHHDVALTRLPGYALRRASSAMMAALAMRLGPLDLRLTDATVLVLIGARTDLTSSEIGKILDIQRANMVPVLGRLEASGYIRREAIDGKSQAILLTVKGIDRAAEVARVIGQFEEELLARIPPEHRDHLLPALQALIGWPSLGGSAA